MTQQILIYTYTILYFLRKFYKIYKMENTSLE